MGDSCRSWVYRRGSAARVERSGTRVGCNRWLGGSL